MPKLDLFISLQEMSRAMSMATTRALLDKDVEIEKRDVKIEELKLEILELKKLDQIRALEISNLKLEMAQLKVDLFLAKAPPQPRQLEQELATPAPPAA